MEKKLDTLKMTAYTVYDTQLGIYSSPICISPENMKKDFTILVNSPNSIYYKHESSFILYAIGDFDDSTGRINYYDPVQISPLSAFIDDHQRTVQIMIQTLNFLPSGYFKMPEEMKKDIQSQIDEAIHKYTELIIKPELNNLSTHNLPRD